MTEDERITYRLKQLVEQHDLRAAESVKTSPGKLFFLASNQNWKVRYLVAKHRKTHPATLSELARDKDPQVRWAVADNPHTPSGELDMLAIDEDGSVQYAATRNPNTSPLVKLWLNSDYRDSMSLKEFLEAAQ